MPAQTMYPVNGRWFPKTSAGEMIVPPRQGLGFSFLGGATPGLVGGRHTHSTAAGTVTKINSRLRFQAVIAMADARVALSCYFNDEEEFPDYTVVYTGSIEKYGAFISGGNLASSGSDPNETFHPLTWGGNSSVSCSPRDKVLSDPVTIAVPAGGFLYVRLYATIPAAAEIGMSLGRDFFFTRGEAAEITGATVDKTGGGQVLGPGTGQAPSPLVLVGTPAVGVTELRRVAIVGDSIGYGTGDAFITSYVDQALIAAGIPHYNVCRFGSGAALFLDPAKGMNRRELIADSTSVICEYGTNDISLGGGTGASYLAKQQLYLQLWQQLATTGLLSGTRPVWQTTVIPRMTSGAPSATPASGSSGVTGRTSWNDWLRAGAPVDGGGIPTLPGFGSPYPYLTGVFDAADTIEADASGVLTRNGTWWKDWQTTSASGLHPSSTGHAIISSSIITSSLT